jgi:hypothetical protein
MSETIGEVSIGKLEEFLVHALSSADGFRRHTF